MLRYIVFCLFVGLHGLIQGSPIPTGEDTPSLPVAHPADSHTDTDQAGQIGNWFEGPLEIPDFVRVPPVPMDEYEFRSYHGLCPSNDCGPLFCTFDDMVFEYFDSQMGDKVYRCRSCPHCRNETEADTDEDRNPNEPHILDGQGQTGQSQSQSQNNNEGHGQGQGQGQGQEQGEGQGQDHNEGQGQGDQQEQNNGEGQGQGRTQGHTISDDTEGDTGATQNDEAVETTTEQGGPVSDLQTTTEQSGPVQDLQVQPLFNRPMDFQAQGMWIGEKPSSLLAISLNVGGDNGGDGDDGDNSDDGDDGDNSDDSEDNESRSADDQCPSIECHLVEETLTCPESERVPNIMTVRTLQDSIQCQICRKCSIAK